MKYYSLILTTNVISDIKEIEETPVKQTVRLG